MKKLLLASVLALAPLTGLPTVAHAQQTLVSVARPQIQRCYSRYSEAIKTKNLDMLNGLFGPDYTLYTMAGMTTDRTQNLNSMSFMFRLPMRFTRYDTRITSIEARGEDMVVRTELTMEYSASSGSRTVNGKAIIIYRDFWSPYKNSNGWVIRQSVEKAALAWVNGKKFM